MRPAVLLVDPDGVRRPALAQGLAGHHYEVIPTGNPEEGSKFAQGLGPSVIVGPADLPGLADGSLLGLSSGDDGSAMRRTLVLLGLEERAPDDLAKDIYYLPVEGLTHGEIVQRLRLMLVGRELGLRPDLDLRYLVGDLSSRPMLDLARALFQCRVTSRVEPSSGGELIFENGRPVHATLGRATGAKAFCRLCRLTSGPFRVRLAAAGKEIPESIKNLQEDLDTLSIWALDEAHLEIPDPRAQVRLVALKDIPSGELSPHEKLLAEAIHRLSTVGEVLDNLSATDGLVVKALHKMVQRGALVVERPKCPVRVVTDSTCDLPLDVVQAHDILVVPITVAFGDDRLRDGVDLRRQDFYQMLREDRPRPRTEPPSEAVFYEHFYDLIPRQDILSIHVSSRLSETYAHARKAAMKGIRSFDHLPPERRGCALEVLDSRSVSFGVGMQAVFAARMAMRGEKVFTIAERLRNISARMHLLFGVDSLDSLVKGGRLDKPRAMVGRLLNIKPILGVVDGQVAAVDRARGGRRVHPRIVAMLKERIDPKRPVVACVAHAEAPVWADRMRRLIHQSFRTHEMFQTEIGPAVGTHTGPGCVGVVLFQPTDEEWSLIAPLDS